MQVFPLNSFFFLFSYWIMDCLYRGLPHQDFLFHASNFHFQQSLVIFVSLFSLLHYFLQIYCRFWIECTFHKLISECPSKLTNSQVFIRRSHLPSGFFLRYSFLFQESLQRSVFLFFLGLNAPWSILLEAMLKLNLSLLARLLKA